MVKMYQNKYHKIELSNYSFLITGGAGFIGSNIVQYLIGNKAKKVRVLDNLSTGNIDNLAEFINLPNFEFINGDIRDFETCTRAVEDINFISHQAALGSVPRSINDPILSNDVNVTGFLNMLVASKNSESLIRFVYAASSSTYGDSVELPKVEGNEGKPISPYAVTKAVNEMYADVFSKTYEFNTIGLRYFNVFGPKQSPNNAYAAVIPIFCKCILNGERPIINGDGTTSRDFTFVENVVQANMKAFEFGILDKESIHLLDKHQVFNVACGNQISLNEIIGIVCKIENKNISPIYREERRGDVKHSKASIEKIVSMLEYYPLFDFENGISITLDWYKKNI
jgi:UDP-N-acetylglucosamine 4-epimerase